VRQPAQRRGHRLRAGDRPAGRFDARFADLAAAWPALLADHYARGFSVARRLGCC
jgi:hypothetical protein